MLCYEHLGLKFPKPLQNNMKERLNKIIAASGICSRRKADELISLGKVSVNGEIVKKLGTQADLEKDDIIIENKPLEKETKAYIMVNKPSGYTTTTKDPYAEKTVLELLPKNLGLRLFPVGRLDKDTTGLLILTNDGNLGYKLTHPKHKINRIYEVKVERCLDDKTIKEIEKGGLEIDDYKTSVCKIKVLTRTRSATRILINISEGKKREIRKIFSLFKHKVKELKRIQFGKLKLGNLPIGKWKKIRKNEII
jgi:23S rRNA pseudouridine2605 synthase